MIKKYQLILVGLMTSLAVAIAPVFAFSVGEVLLPEQDLEFNPPGVATLILRLQGDGNLVSYNKKSFYDGRGVALWSSRTEGMQVEYISFRNGEIQFFNKGRIVNRTPIGQGTQVCLTSSGKPVGCYK